MKASRLFVYLPDEESNSELTRADAFCTVLFRDIEAKGPTSPSSLACREAEIHCYLWLAHVDAGALTRDGRRTASRGNFFR